jgi:hypothetical protein
MRHKTWMLLIGGLLVAQGAVAGDERENWDDSHMRSRHQPAPPSHRPRIEGTTGYAQILNGGAETKTEVATELEFTTQREWAQGPLSISSSPSATARSSSGPSAPNRGSQLRSGSVHSRR